MNRVSVWNQRVLERREQLHGIGGLQVEQRMGDRADVAERDEPRHMHGQSAPERLDARMIAICIRAGLLIGSFRQRRSGHCALQVPSVQQPQQSGQQRRHQQDHRQRHA